MRVYVVNYAKYTEGVMLGKWIDMPLTTGELQKVFIEIETASIENGEYRNYYINPQNSIVYEERAVLKYEGMPIHIVGFILPEHMNLIANIWENLSDEDKNRVMEYAENNEVGLSTLECINVVLSVFLQRDISLYSFSYETACSFIHASEVEK